MRAKSCANWRTSGRARAAYRWDGCIPSGRSRRRAAGRSDRNDERGGYRGPLRRAEGGAGMNAPNKSGWKPAMHGQRRRHAQRPANRHRQPRADAGRTADLRDRPYRPNRRRFRLPAPLALTACSAPSEARRPVATRLGGLERLRHWPARPDRAGNGASLHAPQPPELRDRPRPVPARQLHDEAQSAPEREGRADARLCRCPSAAAGRYRARRAGRYQRTRASG